MKSPQANESAVGNFGYWDIILCPFCFQRNATCHENMLGKSAKQIFDMMRDHYIGPVRHVASPIRSRVVERPTSSTHTVTVPSAATTAVATSEGLNRIDVVILLMGRSFDRHNHKPALACT